MMVMIHFKEVTLLLEVNLKFRVFSLYYIQSKWVTTNPQRHLSVKLSFPNSTFTVKLRLSGKTVTSQFTGNRCKKSII